jgi:DNA polymerase-3 subunit delta'
MSIYPWQQSQWQVLMNQYRQGKLPHAILCKGPEGLGKVDFAYQLAKTLLCERQTEKVCGECRGCFLSAAGTHPDLQIITPVEIGKSIKIDQIRELIDKLAHTSHRGGVQVVIIHPAEAMNRASHNALLKTLEEPIGSVVMILCANQLASIPATIISRTQIINFQNPSIEQAQPWLMQKLNIPAERAQLLLQWSAGAPLKASELEADNYANVRDLVLNLLCQLLENKLLPTAAATELLKNDLAKVLAMIFSLGLDIMRLAFNYTLQNQDRISPLKKLQAKINLVELAEWLPRLLQAKNLSQIITGINVQLLLEEILLNWQALFLSKRNVNFHVAS